MVTLLTNKNYTSIDSEESISTYIMVYQTTPKSLRAIFFHLKDHCVVFKSARQFWKNVREDMKNTLQIMHLEPCWHINWPIYDLF